MRFDCKNAFLSFLHALSTIFSVIFLIWVIALEAKIPNSGLSFFRIQAPTTAIKSIAFTLSLSFSTFMDDLFLLGGKIGL